ncbi:gamma-glutamyltransferase [Martelella sp. AD-3]|uniref:gamma-glutamyltransferase family protein n=1 Tax=Martelella sp. AD-3 TaxID=686597 RepID=UPI0004AEC9E1|nr:gamma-glutamyltransferase [Martelella sp. AD-3]AMM86198.1 gamma-glutamyltransferase [Martelella sp. AD-3]
MMQTWNIKKPAVASDKGIVAAQHFEAAEAGARVLAAGGNAMDAAVTAAFVLSIVEPWLSGIGGGGFLLWSDADGGPVEALDFNVRSSRNMAPEQYPLIGGNDGDWFDWPAVKDDRNIIGYSSICVPGSVAGLAEALEKHGTLGLAEALQPAIAIAERGMLVDWFTSLCLAIDQRGLSMFPETARLFLDEDGHALKAKNGAETYLPMPAKAKLLKRLAKAGARDFYEGEIAAGLVRDLNAGGSVIDAADLADYRPEWIAARAHDYRGHEVNVASGLGGGPSLLDTLKRLETTLPVSAIPGAPAAKAYARAIRATYADRLTHMGHAGEGQDCTSHLSVVDAAGNMVSLTNTLLSRFGSKVVLPESGMLMNNGMMWFDPRPGVPNRIAPDVKPLANMAPVIVRKAGRPWMAIGAAGGRQIFPALTQILSYVIDGGMDLSAAFHTPRIDASAPTIAVDRAADADVAAAIAEDFAVNLVTNTLHPVNFSIPSAVMAGEDGHVGMVHPVNPWAKAVAEDDLDG